MELRSTPATTPATQEAASGPPLIRDYKDYRAFIRDWYQFRKKLRPGFSYRRFSMLLGLKSPNYMQLVVSGQRHISSEMAEKLARLMGLQTAECNYFFALVRLENSQSENARPELKQELEQELLIALKQMVTTPLGEMKSQILTEWYHMLVRELVFLADFEPSGEYISRHLNSMITPEEGAKSFDLLFKTGLITQNSEGKFQAADLALDTGDYVFTRAMMQSHHGDTLNIWGTNLGSLNPAEQELGLLHIPINSAKIPELRERIRRFQDEIIGWLQSEKEADRVVQLGTYMIPYDKS